MISNVIFQDVLTKGVPLSESRRLVMSKRRMTLSRKKLRTLAGSP